MSELKLTSCIESMSFASWVGRMRMAFIWVRLGI
jgi:hypothetical protein